MKKLLPILLCVAAMSLASQAVFAEDVVLQIDWLPAGDKAFAFVGVAEGFFEEEGLNVEIRSGRGSSDALTKLATGSADFATGAFSALVSAAAEAPIPVKGIYSIFSKQPDATVVLKDSGITSIADLKGKSVAVAALSGSSALRSLVMEANGLSDSDIVLKQVEPALQAPMLAAGQVDAIDSWVTTAPIAVELLAQNGKEATILPWSEFGLNGYGLSLYTSDTMLQEHPDTVEKFVRAFDKAVAFMIANPQKAAEDVHNLVAEVDEKVATDQVQAAIPLIKNEISDRDGLGAFNPELLRTTWETVAKSQGYALDLVDPEALVDRSYVE